MLTADDATPNQSLHVALPISILMHIKSNHEDILMTHSDSVRLVHGTNASAGNTVPSQIVENFNG